MDVVAERSVLRLEVEDSLSLGVGGEPILAVDLLIVGGEGRLEVFVAAARVLGNRGAVHEDDLEVLLVDPDLALEVVLVLLDGLRAGLEDVGVEVVDLLAAEVGDGVLGQVFGGEDEGKAMLDFIEVGGGHHDPLERVLRREDDVFGPLAILVKDDVGDLLVLPVDFAGVTVEGVDLDRLAEDVAVTGLGKVGLALAHLGDDLFRREVLGRAGIERAEALLCTCGKRRCESKGESESGARFAEELHRVATPVWANFYSH